jgi:hypothetical protein
MAPLVFGCAKEAGGDTVSFTYPSCGAASSGAELELEVEGAVVFVAATLVSRLGVLTGVAAVGSR